MTNSEQAIREFAEKHKTTWYPSGGNVFDKRSNVEDMVSDLTALISEHYYSKEFVEWMIKNEVFMGFPFERNNEGKLILSDTRDMTTKSAVFTTDELFNYWKENESSPKTEGGGE